MGGEGQLGGLGQAWQGLAVGLVSQPCHETRKESEAEPLGRIQQGRTTGRELRAHHQQETFGGGSGACACSGVHS